MEKGLPFRHTVAEREEARDRLVVPSREEERIAVEVEEVEILESLAGETSPNQVGQEVEGSIVERIASIQQAFYLQEELQAASASALVSSP